VRIVVETKIKGENVRGTVVGYVGTEAFTHAVILCGDRLLEQRIGELKVVSADPIRVGSRLTADDIHAMTGGRG
jgi:hypothetical protein